MFKLGLKLWSINENYIKEAVTLFENGIYDYIELLAVPGSYESYIHLWRSLNIPFVVHAPSALQGMNMAKREHLDNNKLLAQETQKFADDLSAETIIFHPGIDGDIKETVNQLNMIADSRIVIENKPYHGIVNDIICNGSTPEEIKYIMDNAKVGFCLDIGHAACAANTARVDVIDYIKSFIALNPRIYHISDNDGKADKHYHLGRGNIDIPAIIKLLSPDSTVTIETIKDSKEHLDDFKDDVSILKGILNN